MNKPEKKSSSNKSATESESTFKDLDLTDEMMKALERAGYEIPSPVQAGVIPPALEGLDVMGQAQTGTGKTAAFTIPILEQLAPRDEIATVQALVLVPTRELAVQVRNEFEKLAYFMDFKTCLLYTSPSPRDQRGSRMPSSA